MYITQNTNVTIWGSELTAIQLFRLSCFVIVLQNSPIRTQHLLYMTFSLDVFRVRVQTIIEQFYNRKTWLKMETMTEQ